ncbi:hypothetical protein [Haladaptatus halobius]|uniref:hypothetical protein n=1 Tax=Haladaptatus halobius TaxID=2884875 RepID=UPI001D0A6988|nr:hypothetical protein [Haladaptatus halobius]
MLDENGDELDQLTLSPGDELRLTAFNVESDAAVEELPPAVREGIPSSETRERRNEETIPAPRGTDLEELHEAAEAAYPDHSLSIVHDDPVGPDARRMARPVRRSSRPGHHGQGPHGPGGPHGSWWADDGTWMLAPPLNIWHHANVPTELGFVVETTGSFGFVCTVYCGYGHPYMAERSRVVVEE